MSEEKLRSDEVPQKFTEWLLFMGCPADKIPQADKVSQICRGQYYMVWRNLMEHVQSKDVIRQKRLQVFHNDIQKCKKAKNTKETVLTPQELSTWEEHCSLRRRVEEAEGRVAQARQTLTTLTDRVAMKLSQANQSRGRIADSQRRTSLLHAATEELKAKRDNLMEAKGIAESLCGAEESGDVQAKLDKCVAALSQQGSPAPPPLGASLCNPAACSSVVSTSDDDFEEHLSSLLRLPAQQVWAQLLERRGSLVRQLAAANQRPAGDVTRNSITPRSVAAHTAALHSLLSLETIKNRLQLKQTTRRLEEAVNGLSEVLAGPACELAVVRFERASAEARVAVSRTLLDQICAASGVFASEDENVTTDRPERSIAQMDKDIISKKEDIKSLLTSLVKTERKIVRARESLLSIFGEFQKPIGEHNKSRGLQLDLDQTSSIRQFYAQRVRRRSRDLSMEFDTSETDADFENIAEPTFVDELKYYLAKFKLEMNRKLVLESGEKIWVFETLQASADRVREGWVTADVICDFLCPSVRLSVSLSGLIDGLTEKREMEEYLKVLEGEAQRQRKDYASSIDMSEEEQILDRIKKRLNENHKDLQRTTKTLELGEQNLEIWAKSPWRDFVSQNRTIAGKTYKEYEAIYLNNLNPII